MSPVTQGETLLKLVDADRLLLQLSRQLEALPQRSKLAELDKSMEQLVDQSEQVQKLKLRQEMSVKAFRDEDLMLQEKISASQKLIEENSDKYKEVSILATEIEGLNKRIEKITFDIGELNNGIEKINTIEAQLKGRIDIVTQRQLELIESLGTNTAKLEAQIEKLNKQRSRLVSLLPDDLVLRYDKQRELKQGVGAAALDGRICGACYIELSEGQLAKAKTEVDDSGIGICPSCHRLLVMQPA
ncbi:MAG: hypothetical protein FWH40_01360 [Coriobacteriia bacterium]|nr:hypothetical protein [Coriobacteriia bacterium]